MTVRVKLLLPWLWRERRSGGGGGGARCAEAGRGEHDGRGMAAGGPTTRGLV